MGNYTTGRDIKIDNLFYKKTEDFSLRSIAIMTYSRMVVPIKVLKYEFDEIAIKHLALRLDQ